MHPPQRAAVECLPEYAHARKPLGLQLSSQHARALIAHPRACIPRATAQYGVGWVLRADTDYVCSYTGDGGTQGQPLGACQIRERCTTSHPWFPCQWPSSDLANAIATQQRIPKARVHYNEFIVNATYWEEGLPDVIDAALCTRRHDCWRARAIHARFLAAYRRTARQTPLVYYNGSGFVDIS